MEISETPIPKEDLTRQALHKFLYQLKDYRKRILETGDNLTVEEFADNKKIPLTVPPLPHGAQPSVELTEALKATKWTDILQRLQNDIVASIHYLGVRYEDSQHPYVESALVTSEDDHTYGTVLVINPNKGVESTTTISTNDNSLFQELFNLHYFAQQMANQKDFSLVTPDRYPFEMDFDSTVDFADLQTDPLLKISTM